MGLPWYKKLFYTLRKPFDYVCHEDTGGIADIGYFFAWLASGTDCRCCLGTRTAVAFVLGVVIGLCL